MSGDMEERIVFSSVGCVMIYVSVVVGEVACCRMLCCLCWKEWLAVVSVE